MSFQLALGHTMGGIQIGRSASLVKREADCRASERQQQSPATRDVKLSVDVGEFAPPLIQAWWKIDPGQCQEALASCRQVDPTAAEAGHHVQHQAELASMRERCEAARKGCRHICGILAAELEARLSPRM
ncbi:hypothetical protein [Stenotrophomonas sp.]|uniref:hypothetical protein n=1 Tax=Stenotrophomonas sp. TaxID=69392 RepID=UPI0028979FFC|nr:hypothetical protein [Stenotrophomonas sp.]